VSVDGMNETAIRIFGLLVAFYNRQRFVWQSAHGLIGHTLTDAELRECISDVYERWCYLLSQQGVAFREDERIFFKDALIKKVMGPTKRMW